MGGGLYLTDLQIYYSTQYTTGSTIFSPVHSIENIR